MSRYCQGIVNNSKNNVKDKWQFFTLSRKPLESVFGSFGIAGSRNSFDILELQYTF